MEASKPSHVLSIAHRMFLALSLVCFVTAAAAGQGAKQRKREPRPRPDVDRSTQAMPPREALDGARSAPSQPERIALLEKFIASNKGGPLEVEARESLMREYALKGEQLLREGNPQGALQSFKSAFRAAPAVINDKIFGQYVFPLPVAMNAFGYRAESADLMRSFESRFSTEPNRLVEIGFFYVQIEAPFEAVRVLERAAQLAPQDHRVRNSLGTAYLINLRLDDAAAEFRRALELDASDEYANLNMGNLSRATSDFEQAVNYYRRQIAIKSDDAEARGGLAIALLALGRDEEAEPEIKRAIQLAPADYRFLTQLAYFYTNRKKIALARPLIEQAVKIEPRYGWAFITKANIDMLDGRFGDALATLISAQAHASFSTLSFELVKALMALDGYDQALEIMNKSFTVSESGEFETLLGGAIKARSPRLDILLERERQAALFLNEHPTTTLQYRLAEALGKIDYYSKMAVLARKQGQSSGPRRRSQPRSSAAGQDELKTATRPRRASETAKPSSAELSAGSDAGLSGVSELLRAVTTFTTLDDGRQPFRMVWVSRKLTDGGIALDAAEQLARRAIEMAEAATEPEGSMRDAPLLNREGRRAVFLGRAYDALGWVQLKKGDSSGAVESLSKSVEFYLPSAERKTALWHLAVATLESGNERRALDLYIASYDPNVPTSSVRRAQIESLYKKLNGSLAGLDDKLKQQ
ncbi:MAG TPA: tetratricopeptide repeat protein [Blastocatellia bacterium]|nr:tetratricopeptide repeat protein [Blastocatellia bacterium]